MLIFIHSYNTYVKQYFKLIMLPLGIIDQIIKTITGLERSAWTTLVHRNEACIQILKQFNLDTAPPTDFDSVYAYALIEYGCGNEDNFKKSKPEPVLKLFREKAIKDAFWKAFNSENPSILPPEIEEFLDWHILGAKLADSKINPCEEFDEFLEVFIRVAKLTRTPKEVLIGRIFKGILEEIKKLNNNIHFRNLPYPPEEFKSLILEKIRLFCGRKFVFDAFEDFLKTQPKGYFTVVGDAGMGKSAIAAKYVYDNHVICYFNILAEARNRPELFLNNIRQQLTNRYQLEYGEKADLSALLVQVSKKLGQNKRLVIVVDALDEVEQTQGAENILYLPKTLPDNVYFLLTRRPYIAEKKRLYTEGVPQKELVLTDSSYEKLNSEDVQEYIRLFINGKTDDKSVLRKWIKDQNKTSLDFIEQVAKKSDNNFMYLYYLLPAIARGSYNNLSLDKLPDGLTDYYQQHWVRMGMDREPQKIQIIILFILVEWRTPPISLTIIAKIADWDEYKVETILNNWFEYLKVQENTNNEKKYRFYHASFLQFLQSKRVLDRERKLFDEVNQRIASYIYY
jgi:hypothetical protein